MAQITAPERSTKYGSDRSKPLAASQKNNATPIIMGVLVLLLIVVAITRMVMDRPDPNAVVRVKIVAAARDIHPGVPIGFADIRYAEVPSDYVNDKMFKRSNEVVGRISRVYVPARSPLQESYLYRANQSLSHILENHERAITVKLSEEGLVDHQLFAGDRVDVIVTSTRKSKKYTKTVCHNVKVVTATSRHMLQSPSSRAQMKNRVTLALTPDQAEIVSHAEQVGSIKLALRNRLSTNTPKLAGVSGDDLLPAKASFDSLPGPASSIAPVPPPIPIASLPPEPSPAVPTTGILPTIDKSVGWVVEVFSGSKKDTLEFAFGK